MIPFNERRLNAGSWSLSPEKRVLVKPLSLRCFSNANFNGVRILLGRCVEHFGTDEAFLPLIDALQDYCAGSPSSLQTLRDCAPTWLVQLTGLIGDEERQELQKEVFGATRERMLREYCELLEVLGAKDPVVVVVEDLHWSDYATLDVLSRFARRPRMHRYRLSRPTAQPTRQLLITRHGDFISTCNARSMRRASS
jgi:hypothetical protein